MLPMRPAVYLDESEGKATGTGPERRALAQSTPPPTTASKILSSRSSEGILGSTLARGASADRTGLPARARPEASAGNLPSQRHSHRSSYRGGASGRAGLAATTRTHPRHTGQFDKPRPRSTCRHGHGFPGPCYPLASCPLARRGR